MLTLVLFTSLQVSLVQEPPRFSAHLVQAQQQPQAPLPNDYSTWSREELLKEYNRLDSERPSVAMPIVLMATGAVALVVGLYCGLFGLVLSAAGSSSSTLLIVAAVAGLAGLGLLLSGIVLFIGALHDRRAMGTEMEHIQDQLDRSRQPYTPGPPGSPPTGPVPNLPGPTQVFAPVKPSILLASF
jgi:hypothetical protein